MELISEWIKVKIKLWQQRYILKLFEQNKFPSEVAINGI